MQQTSFPYGKEIKSYNYGEIGTPYHPLNTSIDPVVGKYIVKAMLYRKVFYWMFLVNSFCILCLIFLLNQIPFRVMIAEVTPTGFLLQSGILSNQLVLPKALYRSFILDEVLTAGHLHALKAAQLHKIYASEMARKKLKQFAQLSFVQAQNYRVLAFEMNAKNEFIMRLGVIEVGADSHSVEYELRGHILRLMGEAKEDIAENPLGYYLSQFKYRKIESLT